MNFQTLKDYFQEFIECNQHKIMFLNGKDDIFEEFKVIDAINFLEEKDKEIERLNNIINEQDKELELERKSRQLLTDDLANVCEMSLKKDNIINKAIEYIKINGNWWTDEIEGCQDLIKILKGEDKRYFEIDYSTLINMYCHNAINGNIKIELKEKE